MERRLTVILCADVHGYSRLMGENEEATVRTLSAHRKIVDSLIQQHHGRFVNSAGDSVLAEFPSVVNAVECAVEIQTKLKAENANLPLERKMEFRIGVNLGDVVVDGEQIYGDGINVAARLESLAEPGGIYISGKVHEEIQNKLSLSCVSASNALRTLPSRYAYSASYLTRADPPQGAPGESREDTCDGGFSRSPVWWSLAR
jgi:adenylate cyclase